MNLDKDKLAGFYKDNFSDFVKRSERLGANGFSEDVVQDNFLWALEKMNGLSKGIDEKYLFSHFPVEMKKYSESNSKLSCNENLTYLTDSDF